MRISKHNDLKKLLPVDNVEREILSDIIPWLPEKEIIILQGARQTGKTTILYQIMEKLTGNRETSEIYYYNLDFPDDEKFLRTADNVVDLITKNKKKKYIFIDEAQRIENAGLYLKHFYDLNLPVKMIISGSSMLELKSKTSEPLTGRKILFDVLPFNLKETKTALEKKKGGSTKILNTAVEQLTTYGGYPSIVLSNNVLQKNKRLEEIFNSYIQKDVRDFLKIKNEQAFINLVTVLASTLGNIINKNEISNTLSIHLNTLESYIYYLEQTFIIDILRPFFRNTRKEIIKSPKIYFNDLGIRNFSLKNFNNIDFRTDKGFIFENLIYMILKDLVKNDYKINFWRTKTGAEVDFVVQKGLEIVGIEAKAKVYNRDTVSQATRSFIKTYKPKKVFIINLNFNKEIQINNTKVEFITLRNISKRGYLL